MEVEIFLKETRKKNYDNKLWRIFSKQKHKTKVSLRSSPALGSDTTHTGGIRQYMSLDPSKKFNLTSKAHPPKRTRKNSNTKESNRDTRDFLRLQNSIPEGNICTK